MVFQKLNEIKWKGKLGGCSIIILHRGALDNMKVIDGSRITELKKSYFVYENNGRESTIPLHRVLEITADGEKVWTRKTARG